MNKEEIMQILPHRDNMLLVDEVNIIDGASCGKKYITGDEMAGKLPFFTGLDNVKFRNQVKPGDTFETKCTITKAKGPFRFGKGEGYVDGKLCVSLDFSFALVDKE